MEMIIKPAGDEALVAEFGTVIDENINQEVHQMSDWINDQHIKGVKELLPTFRSLMVFYSSEEIGYKELKKKIMRFKPDADNKAADKKRTLLVPCCYESDFGPDLADMERILGISKEEIIALHSAREYKIYMLGFLPGFVYLGGMDERLTIPRLETPRTKIPSRSVGIGGNQTGIYPIASPGGWRLIGSTPLEFYDPRRTKPVLCDAGEYIRFVPVREDEYRMIRNDVIEDKYNIQYLEE